MAEYGFVGAHIIPEGDIVPLGEYIVPSRDIAPMFHKRRQPFLCKLIPPKMAGISSPPCNSSSLPKRAR